MVAREVEEGHPQASDQPLELLPLAVQLDFVFGVALDQVADAHDERRSQQVDLPHRVGEHARSAATRTVGHYRKVEVVRVVVYGGICPGPRLRVELEGPLGRLR